MEYRAAAASCHPLLVSTHAARLPPGTSFRGVCPPVHPAIVPLRTPQYPQSLADPPPVHRDWRGSIGKRNPARPCDTPCRTVNRIDSQAIPSLWLVTPSVVSEHSLEVPGSLIQSPSSRSTSCVRLELGPLSSADITRPPRCRVGGGALGVTRALASARRPNCSCGFPASSFHDDAVRRWAREGIRRTRFTSCNSP